MASWGPDVCLDCPSARNLCETCSKAFYAYRMRRLDEKGARPAFREYHATYKREARARAKRKREKEAQ